MMKIYKIILPILAGVSVLQACQRSEVLSPVMDMESPLAFFSGKAPASPETKGATPITPSSLRTENFGVFAYWETEGQYFDGADAGHLYLNNQQLVYTNTEAGTDYWHCSPAAYWPLGSTLTFFGYAPYMGTRGPVLTLPAADTEIMPRGHFAQKDNVSEQIDLCLTSPAYDRKKSAGEVPLQFTHALSKVLFYFNAVGSKYVGDPREFMVKSIELHNIVGENSFTYGGQSGYYWDELPRSDVASRNKTYSLSLEDGTLSYVPLPYAVDRASASGLAKYECVNGEDAGILYMLPQPMTGTSYVVVTVSAYTYNDITDEWEEDPSGAMDPITINLPEVTVWEKSQTVCYSASLNAALPMSFSVTLLDWDGNSIEGVEFNHEPPITLYPFGNVNIAPAPLYYNGTTFVIKDSDWNHDSYSSTYSRAAGSYYFSYVELGQFFDSRGGSFSTSSGSIDNNGNKVSYAGYDDWRMPTRAEWCTLTTGASPGSPRDGSTVNGNSGSKFAIIQLDGVPHAGSSSPVGLLIFPDGETITGKALSGINNTTRTTGVTGPELQNYLNQRCVFLPASGYYYNGSWHNGGSIGDYWSATEYNSGYGYILYFISGSFTPSGYDSKALNYFPVRLVRDAN